MRRGSLVLFGILVMLAVEGQQRLHAHTGVPVVLPENVECFGSVPHVPADTRWKTIRANIVVALDGVSITDAKRIVAKGSKAYARGPTAGFSPDIDINVIAYHDVTGKLRGDLVVDRRITADMPKGDDLMSQLIRHYRTTHAKLKRHHVHLLTRTDIAAEFVPGQKEYAIAGIANCIGGIGTKHAFAISEFGVWEPFEFAGLTLEQDGDAKNFAHEMGHVFGAHHHYAECVQNAGTALAARTADVCSLMFNDLALLSLRFSAVETQAIRGFAEAHLGKTTLLP